MAGTSARLAFLGAFLLASIVSVIAVGQRELSKSKPDQGEISVAVYADQGMLFPAGYHYRDRQASTPYSKTSLAFEQNRPVVGQGLKQRFVKL